MRNKNARVHSKPVAAIVLAAGEGTRINAREENKVLYPLAGKPMIGYTIELLQKVHASPIVVVVGFRAEGVRRYLGRMVEYIEQQPRLGTAHAVATALPKLPREREETLVMHGDDSAFYAPETIIGLIDHHRKTKAAATLLTAWKENPHGLGRIIRNREGSLLAIREDGNASPKEKKIHEINTGTYCFSVSLLRGELPNIPKDPHKGEFYLTDIVARVINKGSRVETYAISGKSRFMGVNTLEELQKADRLMRES